MKKSISVSKEGSCYFSTDFIEQGFKGEMPIFCNALTLTIVKPKTTLEDMKRSLEILLQDIDLRIKQGDKEA